MDYVDIQAVESKLTDVTVTPIPMGTKITSSVHEFSPSNYTNQQQQNKPYIQVQSTINPPVSAVLQSGSNQNQFSNNNASNVTKYAQLLMIIEEMGRDIRPTYSGSRSSAERLKRGIVHARILVRECLLETERSARQ
ncbi:cyclin-dependent kinase 2-associated protein 1-like [Toxorhynchites rutilus septentrionalis]|uniref:cyclin-dependent kinase 2-associated protein 1-like n=1 Tax=Toxorhynchites rutilus septentrionalis TaxID=329112 RepID=UPI00247A8CEF|nr:cyclin-dependent kinase 2-associated protein 1-like [Toxorhynchites rutilus septentrionalis]